MVRNRAPAKLFEAHESTYDDPVKQVKIKDLMTSIYLKMPLDQMSQFYHVLAEDLKGNVDEAVIKRAVSFVEETLGKKFSDYPMKAIRTDLAGLIEKNGVEMPLYVSEYRDVTVPQLSFSGTPFIVMELGCENGGTMYSTTLDRCCINPAQTDSLKESGIVYAVASALLSRMDNTTQSHQKCLEQSGLIDVLKEFTASNEEPVKRIFIEDQFVYDDDFKSTFLMNLGNWAKEKYGIEDDDLAADVEAFLYSLQTGLPDPNRQVLDVIGADLNFYKAHFKKCSEQRDYPKKESIADAVTILYLQKYGDAEKVLEALYFVGTDIYEDGRKQAIYRIIEGGPMDKFKKMFGKEYSPINAIRDAL